jgi:GT2 family glycosyltransferase
MVIDDGSTDGTAEIVRAHCPEAVILHGSGNLWWAGSLQLGLDRLAHANTPNEDVVLIANNDTTFDNTFVERGVLFLRAHPESLLCARLLDPETSVPKETGVHADLIRFVFRTAAKPEEINCLPTRGLFLRFSDMKRIGGFHPRLLPHYYSDYEYTLRARQLGYRCLTDPGVLLRANLETTGYHDLDRLVGMSFLRKLFSVKTPLNPVHRSAFVLLSAPTLLKLPALINVWARALPRIVWQGLAHRPFPRSAFARRPNHLD